MLNRYLFNMSCFSGILWMLFKAAELIPTVN